TVLDDAVFEDPEAFTVVISDADYAEGTADEVALTITADTGAGNIIDDDQPTVSIGDGAPDPATEGTDGTITFTVTLSNAADQAVTVDYTTVNGTAVAGTDYTALAGTLTFAAGETSKAVTVTVLDDAVFEDPEAFTVVISDADYAEGTADEVALTITADTGAGNIIDTDPPTIIVLYDEEGIVDEKGLTNGSGEQADGDRTNNSDTSETTTGSFQIDAGINGPDVFEILDKDGNWIDVTAGNVLVNGENGTLLVTLNGGTYEWEYTLTSNLLTHTDTSVTDGDSDRGADDQQPGEVLQLRVFDNEGDVSQPVTLDITVNDDGPSDFEPTPVILVNSGDGSGSGPLDMFDNMGADGLGSVVFTGGNDGDLLMGYFNGNTTLDPVMYQNENIVLTGFGTDTLIGTSVDTNTVILKIDLNPDTTDESQDQYTITFFFDVNDGSGFVFDDFSTAPAGQNKWIGLDKDGLDINDPSDPLPDSADLLITAFDNGAIGNVNTSSTDIGVDNQWIADDQGVRLDFVIDVRRDDAMNLDEHDEQGFLYDSHYSGNNFIFTVKQVQGGTTAAIRIRAFDFTGTEGDTDVTNNLNNTAIAIIAASLTVNGIAATSLSGITVTVDGDSIVVEGLSQGDNVFFEASSEFESVELSNANGDIIPDGQGSTYSGDSFAVGAFGYDAPVEGDQIDLAFDMLATDADGDTSSGTLDVTISPEGHVAVGTDLDEVLIGDSGVDFLVGGGGDDILIGNNGNDTMTGGTGADTFIWTEGQSGFDDITDFNISEGDVLNIADLLVGENDPTAAELDAYMSIASGADTTITIFGDQGNADQVIHLTGFDTTGMNGVQILETLLSSGSLVTD
ncbi:MAG: type I secretion C-terminal target domain-containing protein, partial [Gammaproteobacteria bacterium]|nr:type I secretion C-terminal target domain-containing protein [Gammaproteobacteria bacterium]